MTRYWLKIVLGALLIFALGMAVWFGARKGVKTVHTVFETADPITIPLKFVTFRVDGASIGRLEQLKLLRSAPKAITGVEITVRVDSASAAERLRNCTMRIDDVENIDENTTFVCVTPDNPGAAGSFEAFGLVLVQGTDIVMPLLLPTAAVKDLQHQGWQGADSLAAPAVPESSSPPLPPATPGTGASAVAP